MELQEKIDKLNKRIVRLLAVAKSDYERNGFDRWDTGHLVAIQTVIGELQALELMPVSTDPVS